MHRIALLEPPIFAVDVHSMYFLYPVPWQKDEPFRISWHERGHNNHTDMLSKLPVELDLDTTILHRSSMRNMLRIRTLLHAIRIYTNGKYRLGC